jgi:hypothetical protein
MTFREIFENRGGFVYAFKKDNPTDIKEYKVGLVTTDEYNITIFRTFWWMGNVDIDVHQYALFRVSTAKRNGDRLVPICFNGQITNIGLTRNEIDGKHLEKGGWVFSASKEDACDYIINTLKHKKLELNASIIKFNNLKFGITT